MNNPTAHTLDVESGIKQPKKRIRWADVKQSPMLWIIAVLVAIIFVLHFIFVNDFNEYPSGIVTEFIGIIVTVIFVQYIFDRNTVEKEKTAERAQIIRDDSMIQHCILMYKKCHCSLFGKIDSSNMDADFKFSDLRHMHEISAYIAFGMWKTNIECFFEIEKKLISYMQFMLIRNDYKHYRGIRAAINDFLATQPIFDLSNLVKEHKKFSYGDKSAVDYDKKMLAETTDETYKEYRLLHEKREAGMYTMYFWLFDLLETERSLIKQYEHEVNRIKEEFPNG